MYSEYDQVKMLTHQNQYQHNQYAQWCIILLPRPLNQSCWVCLYTVWDEMTDTSQLQTNVNIQSKNNLQEQTLTKKNV